MTQSKLASYLLLGVGALLVIISLAACFYKFVVLHEFTLNNTASNTSTNI